MAVYFPRGQQSFAEIEEKFLHDLEGTREHKADGIVFVTNQELRLAERETLIKEAAPHGAELYHLERLTALLDRPELRAVRKQFLSIDDEDVGSVILGGQGGLAPGAGGGGGGAIGEGAQGGPGGPGGRIIFEGTAGRAPGAGGGGEGTIGPGSAGGGGGGGGDYVRAEINREEFERLRSAGWEHIEYRVGKGGKPGSVGEDTIVNFVTKDGKVLKSIVAKAGRPGVAPKSKAEGREVTEGDLNNGFGISSILLAESILIRNGLLYLLAAGWEHYEVASAPFEVNWPLALTISTGQAESGTIFAMSAKVCDPAGFQVTEEEFSVSTSPSPVSRPNLLISLRFTGRVSGIWMIQIVSGAHMLASLPIEINIREAEQRSTGQ